MSIIEREGAVNGAHFESFYHEGIHAKHVAAQEEPTPGRIGLLPYGEEDTFKGEDFFVQESDVAIQQLVDYYQRFADHRQGIARIGRQGLGLTVSIHEAPVKYAVLAVEEPAAYYQGRRHPGMVRCVIDVLQGAEGEGRLSMGRYFERHPYEAPVSDRSGTIARPFAPFDYSLLQRAGKQAEALARRQAVISDRIAKLIKVS